MTPDEFRNYLRDLQNNMYNWPNDYFAWERPDGKLFMIGLHSGFYSDIMKYQFDPQCQDYSAHFYGISPTFVYCLPDPNGVGAKPHDPVETLVNEIKNYQYLGFWRDPDYFMQTPNGSVRAHGRWDLAKQHILEKAKQSPLKDMLADAKARSNAQSISNQLEHRLDDRQI